jgi:NhaA family Na+:H+ antiporter
MREFLDTEAAGGIVLLAATFVALLWANSPWQDSYGRLWHTELTFSLGRWKISEDLGHWVNDALMTLFFFVVGLEIKRELVTGELRDRRRVALPAIAAIGGMVVPALLYLAFNAGSAGEDGWGIPMATDIAFAIGVLAVLGSRVPAGLKLFILTLAIVDDVGAIVVIAVFYSRGIAAGWLAVAVTLVLAIAVLRRVRIFWVPAYVLLGAGVWLATFNSGVHATIAGVVLGLLTPMSPPVAERLEHALHPWTSFVVVPIFALANAGVTFRSGTFDAPGASLVAIGIVVGLVAGKTVGITAAAWLAVRAGAARLPDGVRWAQLVGVAAVAGIGFTVSLFVAGLAFGDGSPIEDAAKLGILGASALAAALGALLLVRARDGATEV